MRQRIRASQTIVSHLIEFRVLHGGEFKSCLLALILQHAVQKLGGRPHIVAVVVRRVDGDAVEQAHGGLGALAVHPRSVAPQVVVLEEGREPAGQGEDKLSGPEET